MKEINNHPDISTYTLLYQRLVGAQMKKVIEFSYVDDKELYIIF